MISLVQVVRAERAQVGVDYVLGVGGFDLERVEEEVRGLGSRAGFVPSIWAGSRAGGGEACSVTCVMSAG